jgi:hypothetical protein
MVARLEAYGIAPGRLLDWVALADGQQSLLTRAVVEGCRAIEELERNPPFETRNTWTIAFDVGRFGVNYAQRAAARMGLGSDLPQDTVASHGRVDHEGKPLSGRHAYIMHFDYDELPPVRACWSLAMYDERGCFAINPIDRFVIDGRDPLVYENDGSLDLYIQYEHPGPEREANWLPAPAGPFMLILRLYWPGDSVLDGTWVPPRVTRVG